MKRNQQLREWAVQSSKSLVPKLQIGQPLSPTREQRLEIYFPKKHYLSASRVTKSKLNESPRYGQFDRRLLPALWLNMINSNISSHGHLPLDFQLPFNWDLLNNVAERIVKEPYFNRVILGKINCQQFRDIAPDGQPGTFLKNFCQDYDYKTPNFENDYRLPIKIVRKVDQYLSDIDWRRIHGMMFMLIQLEIPQNVYFMGMFDTSGLMVPLNHVSNGVNDLTKYKKSTVLSNYYDQLIPKYVSEQDGADSISLFKELIKLRNRIRPEKSSFTPIFKPTTPTLVEEKDVYHIPETPVSLDASLFKWNLKDELKKMRKEIEYASGDTTQHKHIVQWGEKVLDTDFRQDWYYGIPSLKNKMIDHYDWRFFHDVTFEDDKELHSTVLHRLARTWFKLCLNFEVPSWLNHGTLIGWYWNGASLPFDGDIDLQLPIGSLHKLLKLLNNTLIYDFSDNINVVNDEIRLDIGAEMGIRSYLFDVDPVYLDRNGINNGENDIDARLIDTETGLYIDLTALLDLHSETGNSLEVQKKYLEKTGWTHPRVIIPLDVEKFYDENDEFHKDGAKSQEILTNLIGEIENSIARGVKNSVSISSPTKNLFKNLVHCKHFHTYNLLELGPLIPTYFENMISYVPANWYRNLLIDYGSDKTLTNDYYNHNKFWESLQLWVSYSDCPFWDFDSGRPLENESEFDLVLKCFSHDELLENLVRNGIHYGLQHQRFKKGFKLKKLGQMEYDYQKEMLPILESSSLQLPLKPEPFASNFLYS